MGLLGVDHLSEPVQLGGKAASVGGPSGVSAANRFSMFQIISRNCATQHPKKSTALCARRATRKASLRRSR